MHFKHGYARKGQVTRLFNIWRGMLKRCNPLCNQHGIRRYAARGITVCPEWQDFEPFRIWSVSNGYTDDLTIERIDNDAGYSPENCRWATFQDQCRNRRTTNWIEANGERKPLVAWLETTGVTRAAYHARIVKGWDQARALGF
jgi:hypothetical protein